MNSWFILNLDVTIFHQLRKYEINFQKKVWSCPLLERTIFLIWKPIKLYCNSGWRSSIKESSCYELTPIKILDFSYYEHLQIRKHIRSLGDVFKQATNQISKHYLVIFTKIRLYSKLISIFSCDFPGSWGGEYRNYFLFWSVFSDPHHRNEIFYVFSELISYDAEKNIFENT